MGLDQMTKYLGCNKFTETLWAFNTKITCHMKVLGMVSHQPWLNKFIANGALNLATGVLVQAQAGGSMGPALLGLDWRARGRGHSGGAEGCHWTLLRGRG